jgi:hypothetical protein
MSVKLLLGIIKVLWYQFKKKGLLWGLVKWLLCGINYFPQHMITTSIHTTFSILHTNKCVMSLIHFLLKRQEKNEKSRPTQTKIDETNRHII